MNRIKNDKILLTLCILFFIGYAVIFVSAFSELPLNVPLWHQGLLLYGHFFPMFFLELLLCRTAQVRCASSCLSPCFCCWGCGSSPLRNGT